MSVHNFIPNMEEGDDSSDAEISPEYGIPGTIQDENEQPSDVISFDNVHGQIGEKEGGDKTNILRFHPLPLPENQSLVDSMGEDLVCSGIQIQAHLRGRFSHSEDSPCVNNPGTVGASNIKEDAADGSSISSKDAIGLIFYRRNKFKVIGTVSVPAALGGIKLGANSRTSKITSLHAELDAIESLEGTPVRVIHSNPKEKGTAISSRPDTSSNRSNSRTTITADALPRVDLRFDRNNSRRDELDSPQQGQAMSVPVCWEKLQFRHATAKKRGTWQYFYLRLTVTATLEDGKTCLLSRTQSSAITVRGRSPQSFPSHTSKTNRTGPLNGRGRTASHLATKDPLLANMQDQGLSKDPNWRHSPLDLASVDCQSTLDVAPENLLFYDFSDLGIWNNNNLQWQDDNMKDTQVQEYLDRVDAPVSPLITSNHSHDNNANTGNSQDLGYSNNFFIPSLETHLLPSVPNLGSIFNLPHSFSADYGNLPDMSAASVSFTPSFQPKADRETHHGTISHALHIDDTNGQNRQSEILEDEMESDEERRTYSYEYIPLSINDWTVPVDAVYRPHGVHARKVQNVEKSITKKRYFLSVK